MNVVWMRVRGLLRRSWIGALVLAVIIGLCAGAAMATVTAGRRSLTAFDRFLEYADPPAYMVVFCPPEMTEVDQESLPSCFTYNHREERAIIRELPEVDAAAAAQFIGVTTAHADQPDDARPTFAVLIEGDEIRSVDGRPIVVEGRWYDNSEREVVVNEHFRDLHHAPVGSQLVITFPGPDDQGGPTVEGQKLGGPQVTVEVVGVVRGVQDLSAVTDAPGVLEDEARLHTSDAVVEAAAELPAFGGTLVRASGDRQDVAAAIERSFPGRIFNASLTIGPDERSPIRSAIQYEGRGVLSLGLLGGAAVAVVTAQAIGRARRRERADELVLLAMGVTRRQLATAAALRGAALSLVAGPVAVATAILLSPVASIGVGRLAEPDPGLVVDWVVLGGGLAVLAVFVVASAWWPGRTTARERSALRSTSGGVLTRMLPPVIGLGTRVFRSRRGEGSGLTVGTALTTVVGATAAVAAAFGLTASLDDLTNRPERYGAPWDIAISGAGVADPSEAAPLVRERDDVAAAAVIVGVDVLIDGEDMWVHAFDPLPGIDEAIDPPIVDGRGPVADDEIALGAVSMDSLGLSVGEEVMVRTTVAGSKPTRMTIVGTALVNDLYEASPGRGGIVTGSWVRSAAPESTPDPYVVQLDDGADPAVVADELRDQFTGLVLPPVPQSAIRNLTRIRAFPFALAAAVSTLAVGAFVHALLLTLRRNRRQVAVLRALGFTRRQVNQLVTGHATRLAVVAAVVGVPIGVVLGRLGWRAVAAGIGVAELPVTPVAAMLAVGVAVVLLANLLAVGPAWREHRLPISEALRAE